MGFIKEVSTKLQAVGNYSKIVKGTFNIEHGGFCAVYVGIWASKEAADQGLPPLEMKKVIVSGEEGIALIKKLGLREHAQQTLLNDFLSGATLDAEDLFSLELSIPVEGATSDLVIPVKLVSSRLVEGEPVLEATNSSIAFISTDDNITYDYEWTLTVGSTATLKAPAAIVIDMFDNDNLESNTLSLTHDEVSVVLSTTEPDPTANTVIPITITFDREIESIDTSAFVVTNGSLSNFDTADKIVFTCDLTIDPSTTATIDFSANAIVDAAQPFVKNAASNTLSITHTP